MSIYREQIIDHYKHPRNFGELSEANAIQEIDNPVCGDKLKLQIKFSNTNSIIPTEPSKANEEILYTRDLSTPLRSARNDKEVRIIDIKFIGTGCAISTASGSLLTEYLKNKTHAELLLINDSVIYKLLGIEINPGRSKCALLPLMALKQILKNMPDLKGECDLK